MKVRMQKGPIAHLPSNTRVDIEQRCSDTDRRELKESKKTSPSACVYITSDT